MEIRVEKITRAGVDILGEPDSNMRCVPVIQLPVSCQDSGDHEGNVALRRSKRMGDATCQDPGDHEPA
jgi:hypothetical protein